jgi:hypothetical protein
LPSSVNGGARKADEVTTQIRINTMNQICTPGPVPATNGRATKAAQEIAVRMPTKTPSRPMKGAILSAAIPIAVSLTVKMAWSSIRMKITMPGAIPTWAASLGN